VLDCIIETVLGDWNCFGYHFCIRVIISSENRCAIVRLGTALLVVNLVHSLSLNAWNQSIIRVGH